MQTILFLYQTICNKTPTIFLPSIDDEARSSQAKNGHFESCQLSKNER